MTGDPHVDVAAMHTDVGVDDREVVVRDGGVEAVGGHGGVEPVGVDGGGWMLHSPLRRLSVVQKSSLKFNRSVNLISHDRKTTVTQPLKDPQTTLIRPLHDPQPVTPGLRGTRTTIGEASSTITQLSREMSGTQPLRHRRHLGTGLVDQGRMARHV